MCLRYSCFEVYRVEAIWSSKVAKLAKKLRYVVAVINAALSCGLEIEIN